MQIQALCFFSQPSPQNSFLIWCSDNLAVAYDIVFRKFLQRTGLATFKTVDAFTAATLTFKGHYMNLPAVNEVIARWIVDNHYKISGPRFNIYHVSPETENSFEDMITEVCFPVQSK